MTQQRTISDNLRYFVADGPWSGAITVRLMARFITASGIYLASDVVVPIAGDGTWSVTLVVPDTGTAAYQFSLPDSSTVVANLDAGPDTTLRALIAAGAGASVPPEAITTAIDAHVLTYHGGAVVDAEFIRDIVAAFIVGGSNVTAVHDNAANTLTLAAASGAPLSNSAPAALAASASAGTSTSASRADHAHPFPTASQVGAAPASHTSATTSVHGIADTSALVLTSDSRLSDARTPTAHTHDDRYYTETETDTLLGGKAATSHSHSAGDVTSGQMALARGGTGADLSATGGANQVVKQSTAGGVLSVGTLAHSALTGIGANDHHNQQHTLTGSDHTASGLTTGHVLQATGATAFGFGALVASQIPNLDAAKITSGALDPARGGAIADGRPKQGSTAYYTLPGVETSTTSTTTLTADRVRYFPILATTAITLDQLALEVTTAVASTTARMGIYNADTDWQPTSLVVDAGTVDTTTTGLKTASISTTLAPGRYLLALNTNGAIGARTLRGGQRYCAFVDTLGASPFTNVLQGNQTYAALPSTGTTWNTVGGAGGVFNYIVVCRVSTP